MYIGQAGHQKHDTKSGINLLVSAVISISHSHNEIVFVHFPLISYLLCSISSFVLNGMDPAMAYSTYQNGHAVYLTQQMLLLDIRLSIFI